MCAQYYMYALTYGGHMTLYDMYGPFYWLDDNKCISFSMIYRYMVFIMGSIKSFIPTSDQNPVAKWIKGVFMGWHEAPFTIQYVDFLTKYCHLSLVLLKTNLQYLLKQPLLPHTEGNVYADILKAPLGPDHFGDIFLKKAIFGNFERIMLIRS